MGPWPMGGVKLQTLRGGSVQQSLSPILPVLRPMRMSGCYARWWNGWRAYIYSFISYLWWKGDNCRSENVVRSLWKRIWSKHQQTKELCRHGIMRLWIKADILNGSIFTLDSRRYKHLHLDNWQQCCHASLNQLVVLIGGRHHWAATPAERCITSMWRCLDSTELHKRRTDMDYDWSFVLFVDKIHDTQYERTAHTHILDI